MSKNNSHERGTERRITERGTERGTERRTERGIEYIFVYECGGKLYLDLDRIAKEDKKKVIIHPVYYQGYEGNMGSDVIYYSGRDRKYKSRNPAEGTWLGVMKTAKKHDKETLIKHDDMYFHCDGDLLFFLSGGFEEVKLS